MTILVVGGAGYIGAHVVRLSGPGTVVVDDLSTGDAERIAGAPLVRLDVSCASAVETLAGVMRDHAVTAVVHLAAKKQVAESVARPEHYFRHNVGGLANVLDAMRATGIDRLVFSSSAAVYGTPPEAAHGPVDETVPAAPISPYGETKLVGEWMCRDAERAWGLRWCALRYFNVVGAGADELGDPTAQNLVPLVFEAIDRGEPPTIFGDDYPTADGTCVRDYVHVADLAEAHVAALEWLARADRPASGPPVFNVGTGRGSSVRDVLAAIGRATAVGLDPRVVERRPGDPPSLVADVHRIESLLGWRSRYSLAEAVASAWSARRARTPPTR